MIAFPNSEINRLRQPFSFSILFTGENVSQQVQQKQAKKRGIVFLVSYSILVQGS